MKKELILETLTETKDSGGYVWEIKSRRNTSSPIEIWWEKQALAIRKETRDSVDIVMLEVGMAYDLLKAVARALEVGP